MEHSAAIMEDAGAAVDGKAVNGSPPPDNDSGRGERTNNYGRRKRKGNFSDRGRKQGSRKGRDEWTHDNKRAKKSDMGRGEYLYVPNVQPSSNQRLTNIQRLEPR